MNKTKVEIYQEVLRDVSQNLEGTEEFIKQEIKEICDRKKISVEEVIYFLCMQRLACVAIKLPLTLKIVLQSLKRVSIENILYCRMLKFAGGTYFLYYV